MWDMENAPNVSEFGIRRHIQWVWLPNSWHGCHEPTSFALTEPLLFVLCEKFEIRRHIHGVWLLVVQPHELVFTFALCVGMKYILRQNLFGIRRPNPGKSRNKFLRFVAIECVLSQNLFGIRTVSKSQTNSRNVFTNFALCGYRMYFDSECVRTFYAADLRGYIQIMFCMRTRSIWWDFPANSRTHYALSNGTFLRPVYRMYSEWECVLCVCRECIQNPETYCALSNGGRKSPMRQNVFSCRIYSIYTHIDQPHKSVCALSNGGLLCGWSVWVHIEYILHTNTFCLMGLLWPNLTNLFLFTLCVSKQCTLSENAFCPMCSICAWIEWILKENVFCVLSVWVYNALWARMRSV